MLNKASCFRENITHLKPLWRAIIAVVWLPRATHQSCSKSDSENREIERIKGAPSVSVRFTQYDSMEADHLTVDGKRGTERRNSYDLRCSSI